MNFYKPYEQIFTRNNAWCNFRGLKILRLKLNMDLWFTEFMVLKY